MTLPSGGTRSFLEDGDSVALNAHCVAPGRARIGFGTCEGTVPRRRGLITRPTANNTYNRSRMSRIDGSPSINKEDIMDNNETRATCCTDR